MKDSGQQVISRRQYLLCVVGLGLGSVLVGQLFAQTFTTLHHFNGHTDGANPQAGLFLSDNILYGTTTYGGTTSNGTIFAIHTSGESFINLYSFTALSAPIPFGANFDGAEPFAGLILSGRTLYGTAAYGGSSGGGTVFALNTDGSGFRTLYNFTGFSDGAQPFGGLVSSTNTLYGIDSGNAVFEVNTDGTGFAILYSLVTAYNPKAGLISNGNALFGTTYNGGSSRTDYGTVFTLNIDGTGFIIVHSFTGGKGGAYPRCGLMLSGSTLYGTTYGGGSSGSGTIFKVNTDGTAFSVLHSFSALNFTTKGAINNDGANPVAGLVLSGNTLYGAASAGGPWGEGTLLSIAIDGTGFTILHNFTARPSAPYTNSDGAFPASALVLSAGTLYGTAYYGGNSGHGTVFSLSFGSLNPPHLTIIPLGLKVFLSWATNSPGFTLQSTTNLLSAAWSTVSGAVVLDGQNTVTNPLSGTERFFRLFQ